MNPRVLLLPSLLALAACNFEVSGIGGLPGTPDSPLPSPNTPLTPSTPPSDVDAGTADATPTPPNIGAACDAQNPCVGGAQCLDTLGKGPMTTSFPGGICSVDCKSTPCPTGSVCTSFDKERWCMPACGQGQGGQGGGQSSCRPGYTCCDESSASACVPSFRCG